MHHFLKFKKGMHRSPNIPQCSFQNLFWDSRNQLKEDFLGFFTFEKSKEELGTA